MFTVALVLVLVCVVWVMFSGNRLALRLRGLVSRKAKDATDNVGFGYDEQASRITAAKGDLVEFKVQIAKFEANNKRLEKDHSLALDDAVKWGKMAEEAAKKGNVEHVTACLGKKKSFEERVLTLTSQIEANGSQLESLHSQIESRDDQIEDHEFKAASLQAKETSLRMRKNMVEATHAFGGKDSLGDLDAYERQLDDKEFTLDAMEGMSNKNSDLESLYSSNATSVDDEVAALMAQHSEKKDD